MFKSRKSTQEGRKAPTTAIKPFIFFILNGKNGSFRRALADSVWLLGAGRFPVLELLVLVVPSLTYIHENVLASHFGGVAIHASGGILNDLAGGDVVLPAMPGTSHDFAFERALSQRSTTVETDVADGENLSGNVCNSDCFALDLKLADRSRGQFAQLDGSNKSHECLSSAAKDSL